MHTDGRNESRGEKIMEQTYKPPLTNEQTSYRSEAEWQTEGERARPTAW